MAKILLMSPQRDGEVYTNIPNIGMGYVAAATVKSGHKVIWRDKFSGWRYSKIFMNLLRKENIDVVGISFFSSELGIVRKCVDIIKSVDKKITVVIGGIHPTLQPRETADSLPKADFIIYGEGEESFPDLVNLIEQDKIEDRHLGNIPNLIWKHDGNWKINPKTYIADLNKVCIPAWDLIKPQNYPLSPVGIFCRKRKIAPIITSRGCPYNCVYCGATNIAGVNVRRRSVDNVIEEMKMLVDKFGVEEIHVEDDSFTSDKMYVMDFCNALITKNIKLYWSCPNGVRLDSLDKDLLISMERAGCYSFAVGIESGSQRILNLMGRKSFSLDIIRSQIALIKKTTRIEITGFFMLGFPTETKQEIEQTIILANELNLDKANFFNFIPFPGSRIAQWLKRSGKISSDKYEDYYINNITESFCDISRKQLIKLQRIAYIRFYLHFRKLLFLSKEIKSFTQIRIIFRRAIKILFQY